MSDIKIKATNTQLTKALENYVDDKVGSLKRFAREQPLNIDVELEHMPKHSSGPVFRCEIMFELPNEKTMLRAESVEEDMYAAIDTCVPKIKEQLTKESDRRETIIKRSGRKLKEMMRGWWE